MRVEKIVNTLIAKSSYSLGIPPEIIGVGRALKMDQKEDLGEVLERYYLNLAHDL
jgi:phosphoenolpyruvate carboxylase